MMLLPCIAASAQLFACHDTWLKTILAQFLQQIFANLACKPLKLYKPLSSADRNTCVPVSMPRIPQKVFVCDSSARAIIMSCLCTLIFYFGLSFRNSGFSAFAVWIFWFGLSFRSWDWLLALSQSWFSNSAWAFKAQVFCLGFRSPGFWFGFSFRSSVFPACRCPGLVDQFLCSWR